jgi:hypothetical protein
MSETLKSLIVDVETGEIIERDLTPEEIADREAMQLQEVTRQAEITSKAVARESALAKLADLGLTAEEIAAL